jgi:hypothetical protein
MIEHVETLGDPARRSRAQLLRMTRVDDADRSCVAAQQSRSQLGGRRGIRIYGFRLSRMIGHLVI